MFILGPTLTMKQKPVTDTPIIAKRGVKTDSQKKNHSSTVEKSKGERERKEKN